MALDLQQQQQFDGLIVWWQRWGYWFVAVIVVALCSYVGVRVWQHYQDEQNQQVAQRYLAVEKAFTAKQMDTVTQLATELADDFPRHALTARAKLLAAKLAFENNQLEQSAQQLQWVIEHVSDKVLVATAKLRLANVWLDQGNYDAALAMLAKVDVAAFKPLFAEFSGDIWQAKGDKVKAKQAYDEALATLTGRMHERRPIIELKRSSLEGA